MVLLPPSNLGSRKLQQLGLPGRGCSSDDRALWSVWMQACVRASPRAPELPRGNCVPRMRKPASSAGGACSGTRSLPPLPSADLQLPLTAAPPSCRCALPPRRGRPRHARSPEVPVSALPHLSRLPRVTRTACYPSRPPPLRSRLQRHAGSRSQHSQGWMLLFLQVPHPSPEQSALPCPRPGWLVQMH